MHIKRKTKLLIFGIIVIIVGIIVGIIPFFKQAEKEKKENTKIEDYISETSYIDNTNKVDIDNKEETYLLVLEIEKIGLRKGVYSKESKQNTIEKNVAIMKESSLPNEENGNVVLEAHNGTANISFFNQLHLLEIGDEASIYFEGTKYTYLIENIYDVEKDGSVEVSRDLNKNTLTLITCKKNTEDKQLVIILYLSNKEKY